MKIVSMLNDWNDDACLIDEFDKTDVLAEGRGVWGGNKGCIIVASQSFAAFQFTLFFSQFYYKVFSSFVHSTRLLPL